MSNTETMMGDENAMGLPDMAGADGAAPPPGVEVEMAMAMPPVPEPSSAPSLALRDVLVPAAAMAGACIAAVAIASKFERRSPWAGMNGIASGMWLSNRIRPSGRFHGGTAAAFGLIVGGSLALGVLERVVARATSGKVPPGIATAVGGALADRLLLRRGYFGTMARTIGTKGTAAKYAAMGVAAALASRSHTGTT